MTDDARREPSDEQATGGAPDHGDPQAVCDLAAAYAVDAVDEQERAAVEAHLPTCAACRAVVDELTDDAAALSEGLEVQPSAELRARVLDQVAAEPPRVGRRRTRTARLPASRWLAVAAAAALIGVGAWGVSRTLEPNPVDQVISAEDATEHTGDAEVGEVVVITSEDTNGAVLLLPEGLAAPDEGSVYQAWFVGDDGSARSAGVLTENVLEEGEGRLEGALEGAAAVGLSVEPEGGSDQPTTEPIAVVPLG